MNNNNYFASGKGAKVKLSANEQLSPWWRNWRRSVMSWMLWSPQSQLTALIPQNVSPSRGRWTADFRFGLIFLKIYITHWLYYRLRAERGFPTWSMHGSGAGPTFIRTSWSRSSTASTRSTWRPTPSAWTPTTTSESSARGLTSPGYLYRSVQITSGAKKTSRNASFDRHFD